MYIYIYNVYIYIYIYTHTHTHTYTCTHIYIHTKLRFYNNFNDTKLNQSLNYLGIMDSFLEEVI